MGIEADGTIKSCPGLGSAYAGGNVRTCYYAETCMAGCTWTSHALMGRPGNNPMCHHRALEMGRQSLRERLVKVRLTSCPSPL